MPELPEVETIVRQLAPALPGRRIRGVEVLQADLLQSSIPDFVRALEGARIRSVGRRGKNLVLMLSDVRFLVVNLGMTGRVLLHEGTPDRPVPHLGVSFFLEPHGTLSYADSRRFGRLVLLSAEGWEAESKRLGPEPFDPTLDREAFLGRLAVSRAPIRSWLLDQTRIAGVGNIYAAEALFRAKIHPHRQARSLTPQEAAALLGSLRAVLREAIESGGTTLRDYRTAEGGRGRFAPSLRVYGREGEPCPRCKTPIERLVFAGRAAFLCPMCQREEAPFDS